MKRRPRPKSISYKKRATGVVYLPSSDEESSSESKENPSNEIQSTSDLSKVHLSETDQRNSDSALKSSSPSDQKSTSSSHLPTVQSSETGSKPNSHKPIISVPAKKRSCYCNRPNIF